MIVSVSMLSAQTVCNTKGYQTDFEDESDLEKAINKGDISEDDLKIFIKKMNDLYHVHKRRCEKYKESLKKYNECLQIPLFNSFI